jgi:signal transduction histidine kinase
LTTIKQNVDLISYTLDTQDPNAETKYGKFFDRINSEIGRVTNLMNDILLLGRIDSGMVEIQKTIADLPTLIEETIQKITLGRPDGRNVSLKIIGVKRQIDLDKALIEQVIENLISNAFKYSEKAPDPEIILSFESLSHILIKVKDYGIGIPLKDQKNLFNTFYRATNVRNIQGTGLGLSIVKEFVSMHGGTVELISEVGKGSVFIVKIPG